MKFAIDIGHNAPPKDTGAVGIKKEDELTLSVGKKLISILKLAGHVVVETAPKACASVGYSLQHRVAIANNSQADIFVSIHFNAANYRAHGSEVYALSKTGQAIGKSILGEICKLGFFNRDVKRAPFFVLKHTTMPAVLVECCFCDSEKDMNLFDPDKMAVAIATGLIGQLPDNDNEPGTLKVKQATWLKKTTDQALDLPVFQKKWLKEGKYQVLNAFPEEEGHIFIKLVDDSEWFIFADHCEVI